MSLLAELDKIPSIELEAFGNKQSPCMANVASRVGQSGHDQRPVSAACV